MSKPLIVSQTTVATMNSRSVALDYAREQIEHGAHRVTIEVTKADIPSEVCHVTVERHG